LPHARFVRTQFLTALGLLIIATLWAWDDGNGWTRGLLVAATTLSLMGALAIPFVFGSLRSAGSGARLLIGVLIGVTFFFAQRMLESGAVVFDASPLVLAWLPTAVLAAAALTLVARTR
jgi:lipopolysaccharide export system permease protein